MSVQDNKALELAALELADDSVPEKSTTNNNTVMSAELNVEHGLVQPEENELQAVIEELQKLSLVTGDVPDANFADTLNVEQKDAQPMLLFEVPISKFFDMPAGQEYIELDDLFQQPFVEFDEELKTTIEKLSTIAAKSLGKLKLLMNGPEDAKTLALLFIDMAEHAVCAGPNLNNMFEQLKENIDVLTATGAPELLTTNQATQTDFVEILEQPIMATEWDNLNPYLTD